MKQHLLTAAFVVLGTASLIISCKEEETTKPSTTATTGTTASTATTSTTATTSSTATTASTSTTSSTSSTSTTSGIAENTWTLNGKTFVHSTSSAVWNGSGTNNGLMGSGTNDSLGAFQIWFYSQTPATGTYKIVSYLTKLGSTDPMEVSVNGAYGSIAYRSKNDGGSVTVTNVNGVVSATVSNLTLKTSFDGTSGDSAVINGNLTFHP